MTKLKLKEILRTYFRVSTNLIRIFVLSRLKSLSLCPFTSWLSSLSIFITYNIPHRWGSVGGDNCICFSSLIYPCMITATERIRSLTSDYAETFGICFLCSRIRSILTRSTYVLRCTWIGKTDHQTTKYTKKCSIHMYIHCVSCDISVFVITIKRISE